MLEKIIGNVKNGIYVIEKEGFVKNVPAFCGGDSLGVFAGGDNSFIVPYKNASYSDTVKYGELLIEKGYSLIFKNEIGENVFYSYSNEESLVFFYFIKNQNAVKLIAEPFYEFSYNEPFEDKVRPAVITSAACDRNYYVRLPNNKLVVIDGGWRIEDRSRYEMKELIFEMYREMAEICGKEQVEVPLWIITHAHSDHAKVLEHLYEMPFADKFTIDRIVYNFPDDAHLDEVEQVSEELQAECRRNIENWHDRAGKDYPYEDIFYNCPFPVLGSIGYENICRRAFLKYDAVRIKAHDGMRFDLSGVVFEILHTPDDDMPTIYKLMNDTSLVIKMTYENSSTMWLGDMGVVPGDSCIEMYGDYLKCDAVQVSHHGWGSASWDFFKLLKPQILLWNNSEFGFQYADKYQGYGKTESSTRLFNMPCVKQNYFCNTIKMQYIYMPFEIPEEEPLTDSRLLVSAASDKTFMLRLADGRLIMINGGWRKEAWQRYEHKKLMADLFSEMQQLAGSENVTVAAWILTDCDYEGNQFTAHYGECDFADKLTVENTVCSFETKVKAKTNIMVSTGQTVKISDANLKILYAEDDKTVVSISLNGKKIIFTGNMTDRISEEILKENSDISCNIVQIANGGKNNGGIFEFYKKTGAEIQIWNTSEYAYRFFSPSEGYEKSTVSTAVYNSENCKRNYFCDRILPQIISL